MEFDPYSRALHEDPYPVYRWLRDEQPVHRNEPRDFWTLSRHADVLGALNDPTVFSSAGGVAVGMSGQAPLLPDQMPLLIMMDPPRHTQLRTLMSRAFTPRRIARLEPAVRKVATGLLDEFCERGEADLVEEFSAPLPTIVIAELLGVPSQDQRWFKEMSQAITQFDPSHPRGLHPGGRGGPGADLAAYLSEALDQRRKAPRDDLLSALLTAEVDGAKLSPGEMIGFAFLLLVAGNETTTNLISNAAVLLHSHPDERRKLLREPSLIGTAVEEFLRFDSPVQGLARTLTREVTLHGTTLPEGAKVLLLFASANRDERKIADPDRFDVTRSPNPHLGFGFGTHFCLGASLARLEGRVAFEELLARVPDYRLVDERVERVHSGPIRGALSLPIAFGP